MLNQQFFVAKVFMRKSKKCLIRKQASSEKKDYFSIKALFFNQIGTNTFQYKLLIYGSIRKKITMRVKVSMFLFVGFLKKCRIKLTLANKIIYKFLHR